MKLKNYSGYIIIAIFLVATFAIWASISPLGTRFANYDVFTHSLGQITGLLGTVLFALTFVLTTRLRFLEDLFGGLDKVYKTHHLLGVSAFVLLLFHPILLVLKFIPSNVNLAATYLWPSGSWAVNYGIIALVGMIILIILTFFVNLKYKVWKNSHKIMGAVFLVALFHIFMVTTDISRSASLKYWMLFVSVIGVCSHIYGSYLKHFVIDDYEYKVISVSANGKINEIKLEAIANQMGFEPGQFIFIKFAQAGFSEKHPFTIASKPGKTITLNVKELGDFTSNLNNLKVGTKAIIEGPYGRFNALKNKKDQIWIAGGIGITPFLSFAEEIEANKSKYSQKIDLYYCVREKEEAIFLEKLMNLKSKAPNLNIHLHCSNKSGRVDVNWIDKESSIAGKSIYICGPPAMAKHLREQLQNKGHNDIYMEEFNFNEN